MKKGLKLFSIILIIIVLLLGLSILVSFVNHKIQLKKENANLKTIGTLVEVNGHKINVYTEGSGDTTLIFMAGGGTCSPVLDFKSLYSLLNEDFKIVVIEKAGYGFSEISDVSRDIDTILYETRFALNKLNITGPFILCPHSMSGIEAIYWSQQYPNEITSIIGLDMTVPNTYKNYKINMPLINLGSFAAEVGITRYLPLAKISDAIKYGTLNETTKSNNKYKSNQTKVSNNSNKDNNCIICGKNAPNGPQCKECFYEMKEYKDEFDKNSKIYELKDYYFNLKSNIYRMLKFETVQTNCNKLMAIAVLVKELHEDCSLLDRVESDIKDIIEKKKPKKEIQKLSEYSEKQDSQKETILRTQDGHIVKSKGEVDVDDALYNLRIVHCYDKKVSEISNAERTINCDWFIPVLSNSQGIYVEYWGMNTKDYLNNKAEKKKLYKENDIPLIEVEKDDVNDKQGLADRIRMEANELAEKYFKVKNRF